MTSIPALGTPHVPPLIPRLNPLIRRLLGTGLPFGPNVLLTVAGRSSGIERTFPVALLELDGRRYVQSSFGEVDWVRNLRAAGRAVISKGRSRESVTATEILPAEAAPILRATLAPYARLPFGAFFIGRFFHLRLDSSPEQFAIAAREHPMFELRPSVAG